MSNEFLKYKSVEIWRAELGQGLEHPSFDYTKMTAILTCPVWGLIRYDKHLAMPASGRAMALEAGSACHEVFAAVRLWQLKYDQGLDKHFMYHGPRIFGVERFASMLEFEQSKEDDRTRRLQFCLQALYSSGFFDDPRDRRRTMTNLEEACIAYIDRWQYLSNVWVSDKDTPSAEIGIEVPFSLFMEFSIGIEDYNNLSLPMREALRPHLALFKPDTDTYGLTIRYTGRMDGIHVGISRGAVIPEENKTASRLDQAWRESFEMSHQITGYCIAAGVITQTTCESAVIHGLALPLPRSIDIDGVYSAPLVRHSHHKERFLNTLWHTILIWAMHKDKPEEAPRYTHSCNRYFRPCAFLPFCTADDEEQQIMLTEFEKQEWDPLAAKEVIGSTEGE